MNTLLKKRSKIRRSLSESSIEIIPLLAIICYPFQFVDKRFFFLLSKESFLSILGQNE